MTDGQVATLAKLRLKESLTESELETFKHLTDKNEMWNNPPLSKTAISFLTTRYGYDKYAKKTLSTGRHFSFFEKGNQLESEAIDILSKIDKVRYQKNKELKQNDFILGKCDILSVERNKILDVKTSWNINTFLSVRNYILKPSYWYQMQGYLELHDIPVGEVCFVLLNTPEDMVEKERLKLLNRYVFGEISRDDYEKNVELLSMSTSYSNIPMKKRVIRFRVKRAKEVIPSVYKKVEQARLWLKEFDKEHNSGKQIITLLENYAKIREDNIEPES